MQSFKSFYLTEAAISPALRSNDSVRRAAALIPTLNDDDSKKLLRGVYYEVLVPVAKKRLEKFRKKVKKFLSSSKFRKIPEQPDFMSQIKNLDGLESKTIKRGKNLLEIGDMVRGAILFKNQEEADLFVKEFRRKNAPMISEYEYKQRGKDPKFGYFGSHHLDLIIDGLVVELQVMTKRLWVYKEAAHKIYKNLRDAEREADSFDTNLSKMIFKLGNQPGYQKESTEYLDEIDTDVLYEMIMNSVFDDVYESEFEGWIGIDEVNEQVSE